MKRIEPTAAALAVSVLATLVGMLTGCSQPPGLRLDLGATSAHALRGESVVVPVSVVRTGGLQGDVTLAVNGLPGGVSALFVPDTLAVGNATASLHLTVAAEAAEGRPRLTVSAVAGRVADSLPFDLTVASLSVAGTVRGLIGGGLAGAAVAIAGSATTSDENGAFRIDGVAVPYDLTVATTSAAGTTVHVFYGLTSPAPDVTPYGAYFAYDEAGRYPTGSVVGDLSDAVPTGYRAFVCAEGISTPVYGCDTVAAGDTGYALALRWAAGAQAAIRLHALLVESSLDGFPLAYGGYGTADGSVVAGASSTLDVELGPAPPSAWVGVTLVRPAGFADPQLGGGVRMSPTFTLPAFRSGRTGASSASILLPQLAGGSFTLRAVAAAATGGASTQGWHQGLTAGAATILELPPPPAQVAPAAGATGTWFGDRLEVSGASGEAVTFFVENAASHFRLAITGMSDSAALPDTSAVGAALEPGTAYTWSALASPTAATPEEAASGWLTDAYAVQQALQEGGPGSRLERGTLTQSEPRTFTTR